jgi:hypothetical protein|nr:MAG TPA: Suppressor of IKBKE 1, Striatin-3-coil domain, heterotrimer, PROTEIN BINDING.75A [Caudoviricetes sp.]
MSLDVKNDSIYATKFYTMQKQIDDLQQENKQLKEKLNYDLQWAFKYDKQVGNWNKLKKYLHNQIPTDKTVLTKYIKIFEVLDKIQEIEGSDSNE